MAIKEIDEKRYDEMLGKIECNDCGHLHWLRYLFVGREAKLKERNAACELVVAFEIERVSE